MALTTKPVKINGTTYQVSPKLLAIFEALAQPEWSFLLDYYTWTRYEVHHKGESVEIRATVGKS